MSAQVSEAFLFGLGLALGIVLGAAGGVLVRWLVQRVR